MSQPHDIEVRLLGPVEAIVRGEVVDLGGVRQRLLVARLGLAVGHAVPVGTLLDLLWPDDIPDAALGNLQSYVSRVRRRLGKDVIVKDPGGYRLALEASQVDAIQVEDTLARLDGLSPMARAEELDRARRRWRGDSLSDLTDWLGLLPDAVRLDELHLRVVELWAAAALDVDRLDLALAVLPSLVVRHPTSEPLHLALMRALGRARRVDEALRVGHQFRTALGAASGLEPSGEFGQLEQRLLAGPAPTTSTAPILSQAPLPPPNSFIGREDELEQVARMMTSAGVVEIVGPAGVGKTRLILEALRQGSGASPARFVDLATISQPERLVAAVAGALGVRMGETPADLADALEVDSTLVLDSCEHVADDARIVVADIASRRADVTVVCTSRIRLTSHSRCLDLRPLGHADTTRLLVDRAERNRPAFDAAMIDSGMLESLALATDGLPLAVELLSRRERIIGIHALAEHVASDQFAARASDLLPELVTQLDRSYRSLSAQSQRLLRLLSLAPAAFELSVVEGLTDEPVSTLAELVDSSLVTVDHSSRVRYRLLDSVRAVGLAHLESPERRTAETALADWATQRVAEWRRQQDNRDAGPSDALREHTPLVDAALTWLLEAGRREDAGRFAVSIALLATDDPSAYWLQRLRSLAPPTGASSDVADALFAMSAATAAWITGDVGECDVLLGLARSALPTQHDLFWCIDFVAALAAVYDSRASHAERHALSSLADARTPDFARATALCAAALAHAYAGQPEAAARLMALDSPLLDHVGRRDGFIDFTKAELASDTDAPTAIAVLARAVEKCTAAGHDYNRRVASIAQVGLLIRTEQLDQAAELAPDVIAGCCRTGMWPQAWIVARLCAELLAAWKQPLAAAVLIDAADTDPNAPTLAGPDLDRVRLIRRQCAEALTHDQRRQVAERASGLAPSDLPAFIAAALSAD